MAAGERTVESPVLMVTGGTSGLGLACARRFAQGGWRVALTGRDPGTVAATVAAFAVHGSTVLGAPADVRDPSALQAAVRLVADTWGRLDCCLVNAGIFQTAPALTVDPQAFREHLDSNLTGAFNTIQAVLPMLRVSRGLLLAIGSIAAVQTFPGNAAYGASKWGLKGLIGSVRAEEAPHGVRVTLLHPGPVDTPIWDKRSEEPFLPREAMIPAEALAELCWQIAASDPRLTIEELLVMPSAMMV